MEKRTFDEIPVLICGYKEHNILTFSQCYYAVPLAMGRWDPDDENDIKRPCVLVAKSLAEIKQLIDDADNRGDVEPVVVDFYKGCYLKKFYGSIYVVPEFMGDVGLFKMTTLQELVVKRFTSVQEAKEFIDTFDFSQWEPRFLERKGEYTCLTFRDKFYAVPRFLGDVEYLGIGSGYLPKVLTARTVKRLQEKIDEADPLYWRHVLLGEYKGYELVKYKGSRFLGWWGRKQIYAIPKFLGRVDFWEKGIDHLPMVLEADTLEQLHTRIDAADPWYWRPTPLVEYEGYSIIKYMDSLYAVHESRGKVDFYDEQQLNHIENIKGSTFEEVKNSIDKREQSIPVEYAGWLPVFSPFGHCGTHPQFAHLGAPPEGYRFFLSRERVRRTISRMKLKKIHFIVKFWLYLFYPIIRYIWSALMNGARLKDSIEFIVSRDLKSQLLLPTSHTALAFLPSVPFTFGQTPWVIEIEDTISLFYPYIINGTTAKIDVTKHFSYPLIKTMLKSANCRGIITHVRSTAESLPKLFNSPELKQKIIYNPLGVHIPKISGKSQKKGNVVSLLFTSSWHQRASGFYLRGGLDILEAYALLCQKNLMKEVQLTIRSILPGNLPTRHRQIIHDYNIKVLDTFLSEHEFASLIEDSDIYLLPSARIHVVSLLQAMSYGKAIITSDGWGIEEYARDRHNCLVVPGRYGKVTWIDETTGILREDYTHMLQPDTAFSGKLKEAMKELVESEQLRHTIGSNALKDVEENYSIENWNRGMKKLLDMALRRERQYVKTE